MEVVPDEDKEEFLPEIIPKLPDDHFRYGFEFETNDHRIHPYKDNIPIEDLKQKLKEFIDSELKKLSKEYQLRLLEEIKELETKIIELEKLDKQELKKIYQEYEEIYEKYEKKIVKLKSLQEHQDNVIIYIQNKTYKYLGKFLKFDYKQCLYKSGKLHIETEDSTQKETLNYKEVSIVIDKKFDLESIFGIYDGFETTEFSQDCKKLKKLMDGICSKKARQPQKVRINCEIKEEKEPLCNEDIICNNYISFTGIAQFTVSIHIKKFPIVFLNYFKDDKGLILDPPITDLVYHLGKKIEKIMDIYDIFKEETEENVKGFFIYVYYIYFMHIYYIQNNTNLLYRGLYPKAFLKIKPRTLPINFLENSYKEINRNQIIDLFKGLGLPEDYIETIVIPETCEFKKEQNHPFEITFEFRLYPELVNIFKDYDHEDTGSIKRHKNGYSYSIDELSISGVYVIKQFEKLIGSTEAEVLAKERVERVERVLAEERVLGKARKVEEVEEVEEQRKQKLLVEDPEPEMEFKSKKIKSPKKVKSSKKSKTKKSKKSKTKSKKSKSKTKSKTNSKKSKKSL